MATRVRSVLLLQFGPALGFLLVGGVVALIVLPMVGYLRRTASQP
jgi:hypothetical protein